jgi:hypothetical protein
MTNQHDRIWSNLSLPEEVLTRLIPALESVFAQIDKIKADMLASNLHL